MKFEVKIVSLERLEAEALAVFVWEDGKEWGKEAMVLDKALGGFLKRVTEEEEFKGEAGKIITLHTHSKIGPSRIIIAGLGKQDEFDLLSLKKVAAQLGRKAKELKVKKLGLSLTFTKKTSFNLRQSAQAAVEGFLLGTYKFLKYKNEEEKAREKEINQVLISSESASDMILLKEGTVRGEIFSQATIFARDLVNEPASVATPTHLAQVARKIADDSEVKCRIYDKKQMEEMGLGGILGVARGSDEPPKLIRLEYKPSLLLRNKQSLLLRNKYPKAQKKIVLVGKAITFDTGGLSLKPWDAMETMKMDMAGGAAILGIFSALPKIKPKAWVVGFIPAVENMPSGHALKPGDVLQIRNGKTVEVIHTDAEGRIILADALCLGVEEKPSLLLDLATLTGACMGALGEEIAGVFSMDRKVIEGVEKAAQETGEKVWPLPLVKEYKDLLKSTVADLRNISKSKYGGAITAALFLQEFIGQTPWVHLDIAGPAYAEKETSLIPQGGSGFGVRMVLNLLENL